MRAARQGRLRRRGNRAGNMVGAESGVQPATHPAASLLHGPFDAEVGQGANREQDGQDRGGHEQLQPERMVIARPVHVMVDLDDQWMQQVHRVADQS